MSEPVAKALGSGLCAVVATGSEAIDPSEADRLADAYDALRGARPRTRVAGERAAVVAFAAGDEPAPVWRRGKAWATGAGRAYADAPLLDARLEDLDGAFALVRGEGASTVVASDPFGMQALYVAERPGRLLVCTSALALARHLAAAPSRLGLLTFLRAGYRFGPVTAWEGIERLEPATCLRAGRRGCARHTYWRPEVDPAVRAMPLDRAADHCIEVATDTLARYMADGSPLWSDLSGGYDTRLLDALLDRAGVRFLADTRGESTSEETAIARRLATTCGWDLTELGLPPDWPEQLPPLLPTSLAWTDGGLEGLEHAWVLWAHRRLSDRAPRLLYGGGGEHYRSFAWRQELLKAGRTTQVAMDDWLDLRMIHPADTTIFAADPTPAVRAAFRERLERWIEPYADEPNTTQLDVMYAYKVTGHFGQYRSADSAFLQAELPFYFKPIFTAAFSTHYRVRNAYRLQRRMLARLNPAAAAVPTQAGGPAEPLRARNAHRFVPYYVRTGHRALNKLGQKAVGRRLLPPVERYDWWSSPEARAAAIDAVRNGGGRPLVDELHSAPLFSRDRLAAFLHEARTPAFSDPSALGRVLTTELSLRAAGASMEVAA